MIQKNELRKQLIEKRKAIPQNRREEASRLVFEAFKEAGRILSFASFGSEIDISPLNEHLKGKDRLFLVPYEIEDLLRVPFSQIDCVLVPGLAFDRKHFRIGYGKGYYDRFLATVPDIPTIGVGFKEQFYEGLLPIDTWDIPVKEIRLF